MTRSDPGGGQCPQTHPLALLEVSCGLVGFFSWFLEHLHFFPFSPAVADHPLSSVFSTCSGHGGLGWSIVRTTCGWCISVRFDACSDAFECFSVQKLQKLDSFFHVALCEAPGRGPLGPDDIGGPSRCVWMPAVVHLSAFHCKRLYS